MVHLYGLRIDSIVNAATAVAVNCEQIQMIRPVSNGRSFGIIESFPKKKKEKRKTNHERGKCSRTVWVIYEKTDH